MKIADDIFQRRLTRFFFYIFCFSWVDEKTEGKIKKLFAAPLPESTKVVIASALYFKAMWERKFSASGTRP